MNLEELYGKKRGYKMYFFDIDGTITNETEGWNYQSRTPRLDVILKMWELNDTGAHITLWTARHSVDESITIQWLKKHNVPYHQLIMDKPFWDEYVCDKSFNIEQWMKDD